jgi:DNA (cytosine-5)-methyltransferase 1
MGLYQAGFSVLGVDCCEQPNYPFEFFLCNVEDLKLDLNSFSLVWASPPCQAFTAYKRRPRHVKKSPNLIPTTRLLINLQLCGSSFGLDIRRHRLFETSFPVAPLSCNHSWQTPRFPQATNRKNLRRTVEIGVWRIPLETQRKAMGIDWMSREELSQAVPPAYAKYLAKQCLLNLVQ